MIENKVTAILKVFSCCFGLTCTGTSEGKVCLANRYYFGQFGSLGYVVGGFLVFWWLCNINLWSIRVFLVFCVWCPGWFDKFLSSFDPFVI